MATLTLRRAGREKEANSNVTEPGVIHRVADLSSLNQAKDCKGLPLSEIREKKKKNKKDTVKDKKKSTNGSKKRGHSSTPSNSDDTDKPPSEPTFRTSSDRTAPEPERPGTVRTKHTGQPRRRGERGAGKSRRTREEVSAAEPVVAPPPAPPQEEARPSSPARESLRWEGVKEDPAEEEQRLELYRANRRRRYLAARATPTSVQEWGHLIQGGAGGSSRP